MDVSGEANAALDIGKGDGFAAADRDTELGIDTGYGSFCLNQGLGILIAWIVSVHNVRGTQMFSVFRLRCEAS